MKFKWTSNEVFLYTQHEIFPFLGPVHQAESYGWDSTDWYSAVKGLNWNAIFWLDNIAAG